MEWNGEKSNTKKTQGKAWDTLWQIGNKENTCMACSQTYPNKKPLKLLHIT